MLGGQAGHSQPQEGAKRVPRTGTDGGTEPEQAPRTRNVGRIIPLDNPLYQYLIHLDSLPEQSVTGLEPSSGRSIEPDS